MSQITRCPSCATAFRVVADQLRISDGWVRCGQCKEVFDASAHLLPAPPATLLPDVSLTDTRPPPAPVAREDFSQRAWGDSDIQARREQPEPPAPAVTASPLDSDDASPSALSSTAPQIPDSPVVAPVVEPVLDVPEPAVPAFLAASNVAARDDVLRLDALAPYAWRSQRTPSVEQPPLSSFAALQGTQLEGAPSAAPSAQSSAAAPVPEVPHARHISGSSSTDAGLPEFPSVEIAAPPLGGSHGSQGGSTSSLGDVPTTIADELTPEGYPPLELPAKSRSAFAAEEDSEGEATPFGYGVEAGGSDRDTRAPLAPPPPGIDAGMLSLLEEDGFSASMPASGPRIHSLRRGDAGGADAPDDEVHDHVSFVVAARRRAFWRKPAVRGLLLLVLLACGLALALQVALQERDRIAAMDERFYRWLTTLCVHLECEVTPRRQISDVVIESSSFNKARGDSYQLALTLRSTAGVALSVPAVELTLTDVQDQPVVRRVFLPADLGAPPALPSRGEWSTSVTVAVTTGGARVAGYRVLAFYP